MSAPFSPPESVVSQSPKPKDRRFEEKAPLSTEEALQGEEVAEEQEVKISHFLSTTSILPPNPAMDMSTTNFSHAMLNPNSRQNTSSYSG